MAATAINTVEMHRYLLETLPAILEESPEIQQSIFRISRRRFADADETNLRFDRMFEELRRDRELSEKRWKENQQKFEEMQRKSDERWEANRQELEEMRRESNERWKESQQRWEKTTNAGKKIRKSWRNCGANLMSVLSV